MEETERDPGRCSVTYSGYRCYRDEGHRVPGHEPSRFREDQEPPHSGRMCECGEHGWGGCCKVCAWWDWRGRDRRRYTGAINKEEVDK